VGTEVGDEFVGVAGAVNFVVFHGRNDGRMKFNINLVSSKSTSIVNCIN
jgi:hypothetical protein